MEVNVLILNVLQTVGEIWLLWFEHPNVKYVAFAVVSVKIPLWRVIELILTIN